MFILSLTKKPFSLCLFVLAQKGEGRRMCHLSKTDMYGSS